VITQNEAKELTLELWRYLAEHPEEHDKQRILERLDRRAARFRNSCPLCALFYDSSRDTIQCLGCPLEDAGASCLRLNSPYSAWRCAPAEHMAARVAAAERIVEIVSAWEPEEKS
jgi:hypothetical protein